ncbi:MULTISPECIES: hypothetical protein [unclassified Bradyrhizobium]|uniref:hypothetical protein n=1 Tax=unclassified Bradyrhizobium TaxID=2631580 RepID=UPI0028F02324|nr:MULTISPECIES: hypothetical protein [unclassified Bradyrhizobium]
MGTSEAVVISDRVGVENRTLHKDYGDTTEQFRSAGTSEQAAEVLPVDDGVPTAVRGKVTFLIDGPLMSTEARRWAVLENMARDLCSARECSDAGDSRRLLLARGHNAIDVHVLHAEAIALARTWLARPHTQVTATAAKQVAKRGR